MIYNGLKCLLVKLSHLNAALHYSFQHLIITTSTLVDSSLKLKSPRTAEHLYEVTSPRGTLLADNEQRISQRENT